MGSVSDFKAAESKSLHKNNSERQDQKAIRNKESTTGGDKDYV